MKIMRKIIEINEELCDGCGQCVPSCAEGALQIVDGKARLVKDIYCDGLGACLGECPNDALKIIEREAEEFDETAVEEYLTQQQANQTTKQESTLACGCPSTQIQSFMPSCENANKPVTVQNEVSALSHWPIKIRLVPPKAPFLKNADLLVLADCVPVAFPNFHNEMLKGKAVLTGCPKFDEVQEYISKFAEIFKTADIRSVTVAMMEVPCCSGLLGIVKKAMEKAQKNIPIKQIIITARGKRI